MAIDPSIALQIRPPQLDDPLTVQTKQLQLRDLMGRQQAQEDERSANIRMNDFYRQHTGDDGQVNRAGLTQSLAQGGLGARIPGMLKQFGEADELTAKLADLKSKIGERDFGVLRRGQEMVGAALTALIARPEVVDTDVANALGGLVAQGALDIPARLAGMSPHDYARSLTEGMPRGGSPAEIKDWLTRLGIQNMDATKRMDLLTPKVDMRDTGGAVQAFQTNPLTGEVTPGLATPKTATPDAVMTDRRTREEGEKNRAQQERASLRVDARARDGASGALPSKPMPAAAVKLQNEELSALGTFAGLDADLGALEEQVKTGKLKVGPVRNLANTARNAVGMSTEESRNLATFKSKLEGMRNAVLLLNKGVQTEGDAQRAMSEIMANINDPGVVAQRLAEVRALNKRAADLRKSNVDLLRSNYGHEPLDFGRYDAQPAAVGLAKPKPGTVQQGYVFTGGDPADPKSWKKQ